MDSQYAVTLFVVMAVATFFTRAAPFVLLGRFASHPLFATVSRLLPSMIMVVLVFFSLVTLDYSGHVERYGLAAGALCVTLLVHRLFGHALISIMTGTALYGVGIQGFGL
jgi:branched-subunit amino acid transport protein AzlD